MRVLQLDDQHFAAGPNRRAAAALGAAEAEDSEQHCGTGFVTIFREDCTSCSAHRQPQQQQAQKPATATQSSSSSSSKPEAAAGSGGDDDGVLLLPSDDEALAQQADDGDEEDDEEPDWGGSSIVSSRSSSSDTFAQVGLPGATEVVYVREAVAVCPSRQPGSRILGRLSLVKQHATLFLSWLPYSADAGPAAAAQAAATEEECGSDGSSDFDCCSDDDSSDGSGWEADEQAAAAAAAAHEHLQHSGSRHPRCLPQQQQQQQQESQQQPSSATPAAAAYAIHSIPVSDIRALLTHTPPLSWRVLAPGSCSQLVVVLVSGLTLPPLFFTRAGLAQLLRVLGQHASLVKGASGGSSSSSQATWLVNETPDPLQPCLVGLDLDDLMLGAPPPGASSVAAPSGLCAADGGAWQQVESAAAAGPHSSSSSRLPWGGHGAGYAGSSISWGRLSHQPAAAGGGGTAAAAGASGPGWRGLGSSLGGSQLISSIMAGHAGSSGSSSGLLAQHLARTLRQVGQLAVDAGSCLVAAAVEGWQADTLRHYEQEVQLLDELLTEQQQPPGGRNGTSSSSSSLAQVAEETEQGGSGVAAAVAAAAGTIVGSPRSSTGPDSSSSSSSSGCGVAETALGGFELLAPPAPADPLAAVRSRPAPPPLSSDELASFFDVAGVMRDAAGFRQRCFTAGIEPSARREAWPFLLGVFPPGSSSSSRAQQRRQQQQQYAALRVQWRSISPAQAAHFSGWRERRSRIDKDVRRTDRQHPFYRGRAAAGHLVALRDLLRCFSLHHFDLGYCQGMSDLAAPLLLVAEGDEVEAFWWFEALMARLGGNFQPDQAAMAAQLAALRRLVQVLDPQLHAFLEERDCLDLFFAFRWLLIHFKREFPFDEVLRLWEALWSCSLTPHLHLFLAAALLIQHRRALLADPSLDADGLLAFWLGAAGRLDLAASLRLAEALVVVSGAAGRDCLAGLPDY